MLDSASEYEGVELAEFVFHVPTEVDETTIQLFTTFSTEEFWEWFDVLRAVAPQELKGFDYKAARKERGNGLSDEFLIDSVVRAGFKKRR